jgi:YggT family protein
MLALSHLLNGVAVVLWGFLWIYKWILIARAITSWVSANPRNPIVAFLYLVTEPAIRAIRRRLPTNLRYFPLDIAFLVLFALVLFGEYGVVPLLQDYAAQLRYSALRGPAVPSEIY